MEEQDIIEQEGYFWREFVEKKVEPPLVGKPDLVLASIRRYSGYADKSIPESQSRRWIPKAWKSILLYQMKNHA